MKLSIYTAVKDGLYFDFHVEAMLRHHLGLADEIIVNEGYSDDGTFEAIRDIDPKIRIQRNHWDRSEPKKWRQKFINQARAMATGDWCIMLDADEFIPEWEFERLRSFLAATDKHVAPVRFTHFYGNYRVVKPATKEGWGWPALGARIHRNIDGIEVWGDASNVRISGRDDRDYVADESFECHHFGAVRDPARLRHKWRIQKMRNQDNRWNKLPAIAFDLRPHHWSDPDFFEELVMYDGPHMKIVEEDPAEFTRDGLQLIDLIKQRGAQ